MIIGLAALARSGKDTFADEFVRISDFEKYSLADPIKKCINEIFDLDERHSEGVLKEETLPLQVQSGKYISAVIYKNFSWIGYDTCEYLSDIFVSLLDIVRASSVYYQKAYWIASPRQLYQWFGTDVIRNNHSDTFWLDIVETDRNLVIADIRFENEAEWVRENGRLIHIEREGVTSIATHVSEGGVEIKKEDLLVKNDKSLEEFLTKPKKLLDILSPTK